MSPHRFYKTLVITPPGLEHYFREIAGRLAVRLLPVSEESAVTARAGQEFFDLAGQREKQ